MKIFNDPANTWPCDLARAILNSKMPLTRDESEVVHEIAKDEKYIYWGTEVNIYKRHNLLIIYHMAVGYMRHAQSPGNTKP